ncbi:MAG TPA: hypothetical protein VK878_23215 [Candidatus Deferrimicrobiaceae bacterium]|nr:hypothetical protein [Candidatus Deferrimicrobiaceae bacterium]
MTAAFLNALAPLGEAQSATNLTAGTTTSTSYTDTLTSSTTVTLNFTAPPSGSVAIIIRASMVNSAGNYTAAAFRLSGATTRVSSDSDQIFTHGTDENTDESTTIVTGLTAGGSYTATMQHKVTAGTGTYNFRRITMRPIGG